MPKSPNEMREEWIAFFRKPEHEQGLTAEQIADFWLSIIAAHDAELVKLLTEWLEIADSKTWQENKGEIRAIINKVGNTEKI